MTLKALRAPLFKVAHPRKQVFECPACRYTGPFKDKAGRRHAKCPACGALERTRLQSAVLQRLLEDFAPASKDALHVAPEPILRRHLRQRFRSYRSGDLNRADVDVRLDVQQLPFADASFDCVFASHVLEYPADDRLAIREIRRVMRSGGIAVLPVPLMGERTVDLAERHRVTRVMHEPGLDYFERLGAVFERVDVIRSDQVDAGFQPFVLAPDERVPMPLKSAPGVFIDAVPVCFA